MKTTMLTAALTTTLFLTGCGAEQAPAPSAPASTPASAAPASQTEAVYGDEAPVTIDAPTDDAHGHAHEDGDHAHDDGHDHNADGSHPNKQDEHDHGDGSEPHDH